MSLRPGHKKYDETNNYVGENDEHHKAIAVDPAAGFLPEILPIRRHRLVVQIRFNVFCQRGGGGVAIGWVSQICGR